VALCEIINRNAVMAVRKLDYSRTDIEGQIVVMSSDNE
jgi:hypothetical protein